MITAGDLSMEYVRPVARPGEHQRVLFNGHKRVHASVVAPNGLIANLFGPEEGRRQWNTGNVWLAANVGSTLYNSNWPALTFVC